MHYPAMRRAGNPIAFVPSVAEAFRPNPVRPFAAAAHRMSKAERRNVPTRRSSRSFNRFYDRLLTRRSKILFTTSFAAMRQA